MTDSDYRPDEHVLEHERRKAEAMRPLREAGEGESEGFEEAEAQLIRAASHADDAPDPARQAGRVEPDRVDADFGEADEVIKEDG